MGPLFRHSKLITIICLGMTTLPMSDASGGRFFHISLNHPAHVLEKPRVSLDLTSGAKIE